MTHHTEQACTFGMHSYPFRIENHSQQNNNIKATSYLNIIVTFSDIVSESKTLVDKDNANYQPNYLQLQQGITRYQKLTRKL